MFYFARLIVRYTSPPQLVMPTLASEPTSRTTNHVKRAAALSNRVEQIESSKDFRIGEIDFHPFTIPHDAADNFGFTATHQGVKIATWMDFGHITTLISSAIARLRSYLD